MAAWPKYGLSYLTPIALTGERRHPRRGKNMSKLRPPLEEQRPRIVGVSCATQSYSFHDTERKNP